MAIELVPDDADYYNNRGVARMSLFEIETAIDDFTTSIDLNPAMIDAYFNRSMVYVRLQRFEESLSDLEQILDLDPHRRNSQLSGQHIHDARPPA